MRFQSTLASRFSTMRGATVLGCCTFGRCTDMPVSARLSGPSPTPLLLQSTALSMSSNCLGATVTGCAAFGSSVLMTSFSCVCAPTVVCQSASGSSSGPPLNDGWTDIDGVRSRPICCVWTSAPLRFQSTWADMSSSVLDSDIDSSYASCLILMAGA